MKRATSTRRSSGSARSRSHLSSLAAAAAGSSAPNAAIHLAPEGGFRAHAKAHPALVIGDLAAAREALTAADIAIEEDDSALPVSRCYIRDPFGNRIELVDSPDAGFSAG